MMKSPAIDRLRIALWYAIESAFGGNMRDPHLGDVFWSSEMEVLEERTRKRLHLLELADHGTVPDRVRAFIVQGATIEQLWEIAAESIALARSIELGCSEVNELVDSVTLAFNEAGMNLVVAPDGTLSLKPGVDTEIKQLKSLPGREQLKSDLATQATAQIGLIFIDLDHFKAMNDDSGRGHTFGDECLERTVQAMEACSLGKARLYRYGGDEFCLLLPNCDSLEAAATAERIRRAIERERIGFSDVFVTASAGVVSSDEVQHDAELLLKNADAAMYSSKRAGGNAVNRWVELGGAPNPKGTSPKQRLQRLIELAELGVHRIQNDAQCDANALAERRHAWELEVVEALAAADARPSEISHFRVLGTYNPKMLPARTPAHAKIVNEVAEKIDRLRVLVSRIEERSARR